jgi:hypothetical protein
MIAADTAPDAAVDCRIGVPGGGALQLKLDLADDLSRQWYFWGYDSYELSTISLWVKLLERSTTVFDVGANIGMYSMLAAVRLKERGTVHAFEPNPDVCSYLRTNVHLNGSSNLNISSSALSDFDGQSRFLYLTKARGLTGP